MPTIRIALVALAAAVVPLPLGTGLSRKPTGPDLPTDVGSGALGAATTPDPSRGIPTLDEITGRVDRLDDDLRRLQTIAHEEVVPIETVLESAPFHAPAPLAQRIAVALVRESHHTGLDARLLLAVLIVENPWLDPDARSFVGAVGLMQVMPFHAGRWGCGGLDLTDPEVNICHGARILAHTIRRSGGELDRALLLYNGCVRGSNTPGCHRYPEWVRGKLALLPAGARADRADAP